MKTAFQLKVYCLLTALGCALPLPAADLIVNGGFESGFAGWTRADQIGSEGTFFLQTGPSSPVNGLVVPAPPGGSRAAMTDAAGPGSHVLYQDFVVPGSIPGALLTFSLFVNNTHTAFVTPATLDFATPALNQRARVDIIKSSADPFSVAAGDILQGVFQTNPGDPLVSGYNNSSFDLTALLQAHLGETLRLRFAEVDNVNIFNLGVDNVGINIGASAVPDSWSGALECVTLGCLLGVDLCRRKQTGRRAHLATG